MKLSVICLTVATLLTLALIFSGCKETWGDGEPPANYQELFGNDNSARLNFIQQQMLDQLTKRVIALEVENPAELARRVRELEEGHLDKNAHKSYLAGVRNAPEERHEPKND